MLPIVQRELSTAARSPKLHRWRLRVAVLQIVLAAILVVSSDPGGTGGGAFFWFLTACAFAFCFFEGLRKTADSISEEKRDGTLGLLFLTDLKGWDVVLGKLAGAMIRSVNGLLAFIPILAITLLVGGTTLGEFWRASLVLMNVLWVSLSLCLMVSTFSRERSLAGGFALLALISGIPLVLARFVGWKYGYSFSEYIFTMSPPALLFAASDAQYSRNWGAFWFGMASMHCFGWVAIGIASYVAPRCWQDKPKRQSEVKIVRRSPEGFGERAALLDKNPILWLTYNQRQHRTFQVIFFSSASLLIAVTGLGFYFQWSDLAISVAGSALLALILNIFIASQTSMNLAEGKRNGAMELLLSTPMKVDTILAGHWLAFRKMFLPAITVLGLIQIAGLIAVGLADFKAEGLLILLKTATETIFGFFVVGWVGMWMGLSSKTSNRAFFKTILIAVVAPYLILCVPNLIVQVILFFVARDKVRLDFRRFIAEKYLQQPAFVLSPLGPAVR